MARKVRITTYRGDGSTGGSTVGLTDHRLALVERYMIDAEEAESRAQSAAATAETLAQRAAAEQAQRAAEESRRDAEGARRRAEELLLGAARAHLDVDQADQPATPVVKQGTRERARLAKAERRAAKQAARVVAAMEKKEARERKALARAAAKREARERKARGKSIARP